MTQIGQPLRENAVPDTAYAIYEHTMPAAATTIVFPHGLHKLPKLAWTELKCIANDLGYVVGDRVFFTGVQFSLSVDATNFTLALGLALPSVISLASNTLNTITQASWTVIIKAEVA